jgi:hypothetical protein
MNYAWANPTTGIREQTTRCFAAHDRAEGGAWALAEAKLRVWEELHVPEVPGMPVLPGDACTIYWQEAIGNVSVNGPYVDHARAKEVEELAGIGEYLLFAWADPIDGTRKVYHQFPNETLVSLLRGLQANRDSKESVIVYATWPECTVKVSDPRPEGPPEDPEFDTAAAEPEIGSAGGDDSDVDWRRRDLEGITYLDDAGRVALHSAWALLDIASTLRKLFQEAPLPPSAAQKDFQKDFL